MSIPPIAARKPGRRVHRAGQPVATTSGSPLLDAPIFCGQGRFSARELQYDERGGLPHGRCTVKGSAPGADPSAGLRASLRLPERRQQRQRLLKQLETEADPELRLQLAYLD